MKIQEMIEAGYRIESGIISNVRGEQTEALILTDSVHRYITWSIGKLEEFTQPMLLDRHLLDLYKKQRSKKNDSN